LMIGIGERPAAADRDQPRVAHLGKDHATSVPAVRAEGITTLNRAHAHVGEVAPSGRAPSAACECDSSDHRIPLPSGKQVSSPGLRHLTAATMSESSDPISEIVASGREVVTEDVESLWSDLMDEAPPSRQPCGREC
jgi:hypothetical protein